MLSSLLSFDFLHVLRRGICCCFCCFTVKDDHHPQVNRKEPVDDYAANNCLWSVLVTEDADGDLAECEEGRCGIPESPAVDDELRAEAAFLKACGTILETPPEIRKTEKLTDSQPKFGDTESKIQSSLPNTATENESEKKPDLLQSPIRLFEKSETETAYYSSHSSTSFSSGKYTDSRGTSSSDGSGVGHEDKDTQSVNSLDSHTPIVATTQRKTKSVHFEHQTDKFSFSSGSSSPKNTKESLKPYISPFDNNFSKPSPFPTPLKLTDDMQTPGTVFGSYAYNNESGKNQKVRVQYVYSGMTSERIAPLNALIEEESHSDIETPESQVKLPKSKTEIESNVCPTLSSWLPPKSNYEGCVDQSLVTDSPGRLDFGQTPEERPILGVVAANWNAEETSFTPKLWNGNGIPNTTNKYKEDQKVNWHATPFEKRLEKALSEEKFIPQKKQLEETSGHIEY
ncbi:protein JASON-like [Rutidosis leptorrhynchoides]|uniref:protein JASON-like n=1 Tax=Rutidosis leptorrhynchoides TaxID=125765 RepID=UPI003A9A653F